MFDRYWHCFVAIALRIIVTSAEDADEPGYNNHTDPGNGGHVNATTGTAVPSSYGCDIENPWYHTPVTCIKLVSTLCAFLTLVTYTCVLKQLNRINYVKHYAACLTVSMGLNLLEDAMFRHADHRRPFTFVHKTFGYLKFFVHLCTHNWQVVTSYEVFLFLWNINFDQLNKFHKRMVERNLNYHIYCWGFPIICTSIAICIDNEEHIFPDNSYSLFGLIKFWFSKIQLHNKYDFFLLFPGFINLILNTILIWNTIQYRSKLRLNIINKPIPIIKKLNNLINVRKQLFALMTLLWIVDLLCSFEQIRNYCTVWQILHDIKALQGAATYVILVYSSKIPIREEWKLRKIKLMQVILFDKIRDQNPIAMTTVSSTIPD